MTSDERVRTRLDALVETLRAGGSIRTDAVERAMRAVPRHEFIDYYYAEGKERTEVDPANDATLDHVYSNDALVTRVGENGLPSSSSSQPSVVAVMLEALEVHPRMRVLEIGAGTGYNAAILAELTGDPALVTSIDIQPDVIEQTARNLARSDHDGVDLRVGDGFFGAPDAAPFDRIIVTVGPADLSPHWIEQLAASGHIITPLPFAGWQPHFRVRRDRDAIRGRFAGWTGFMAMTGAHPWDPMNRRPQIEAVEEEIQHHDFDEPLALDRFGPLWFFAALDPRTVAIRGGFGIVRDPLHWAAVDRETGGIAKGIVSRNAPDLVEEMARIASRFDALGAPAESDWISEFVPHGDTLPDAFARIERSQYTQCISLEPPA